MATQWFFTRYQLLLKAHCYSGIRLQSDCCRELQPTVLFYCYFYFPHKIFCISLQNHFQNIEYNRRHFIVMSKKGIQHSKDQNRGFENGNLRQVLLVYVQLYHFVYQKHTIFYSDTKRWNKLLYNSADG